MPAVAESFVNPLGLAFTIVMGILLVLVPRRYTLVPVIMLTCFMSMGQVIVVLGLHFTMLRILALFGWARLVIRGEIRALRLNPIDKALLWWTIVSIAINTLLWQTSAAFVNRLGFAYNAIGLYFLFRFLVQDFQDIKRVFKITATFIIPLAVAMLSEWITGKNVFTIFGVPNPNAQIRDGIARCEGPFSHPILAGTFAATLLPFFVALWQQGRSNKLLAGLAILSSSIIIAASGSSGPILSCLAAIAALYMWLLRKHMRTLRWGFGLGLTCLHLVMKAPVWFLIARIDLLSGSTGFHRALLIDQAITHFSQWCLLGTKSVEIFGENIHGDITNQYIAEGVNGGVLAMILFIVIIVRCFRGIGRFQALTEEPTRIRRSVWALGAALFSHVVTYFSITYFDQNFVNWYLLLALISTATGGLIAARHGQPLAAPRLATGGEQGLPLVPSP